MIVKLETGGTTTVVGGSAGAKAGFMNSGAYSAIANGVGGVFDSIPTPNQELNENNNMMAGIRSTASSALMASGNPYAMAAGVALKIIDKTGGFVDASKGLGGTNDTLNAVASLALPGAGWFASKTENYKISSDMKAMASGYASAMKNNKEAQQNAGAKILFGKSKANTLIHVAKVKDRMISNIKQDADDAMQSAATMTQARAMQNQYDYMGGYNQALARAAKNGAKLEQIIRVKKLLTKPKEIEEFKEGGTLPEEFIPTTKEQDLDFFNNLTFEDENAKEENIIQQEETLEQKEVQEFKKGGKKRKPYSEWVKDVNSDYLSDDYDLEKAYNELPIEELEAWKKDPKNNHLGDKYKKPNHMTYSYPGYGWTKDSTGNDVFVISPEQYLLHGGNDGAWDKYVRYWNENEPTAILRDWTGKLQYRVPNIDPDKLKDQANKPIVEKVSSTYVQKPLIVEHKEGGAVNVIPEGNLHARLHHMEDADNLTKKGVPVVDRDGNQQAEIELNEIILHLELSQKLEELCKKFYSEETKPRDKEDLAIEAGKLLAKEIMENTEDRTGLMNEVA